MSYSIMYESQFIRSSSGITPVVLMGDNNVWEGHGKYERRARDWGCFCNLLGVSETALVEKVKSFTGGPYQEHWKTTNGQWVNDSGLMRWANKNIKNAMTVEEILTANHMSFITCRLVIWNENKRNEEMRGWIHNTQELDEWISKAKERMKDASVKENLSFYPIVSFSSEKLVHKTDIKAETVILKRGQSYLSQITEASNEWTHNIKNAMVFTKEEAIALQQKYTGGWIPKAQLVDAKAKDAPYDTVIKMVRENDGRTLYVRKVTSTRIVQSFNIEGAKRYRDFASALKAVSKLQKKFTNWTIEAQTL